MNRNTQRTPEGFFGKTFIPALFVAALLSGWGAAARAATGSGTVSQLNKQASLPVQPPKATRQVRPMLPANVSALVSRRAEIDVRVDVDRNGNVVHTQPLESGSTLNAYLGNAAAAAAQLWKFEPAKRGSQSIAAPIVLRFVFEPDRR
jgi:TonB family protein